MSFELTNGGRHKRPTPECPRHIHFGWWSGTRWETWRGRESGRAHGSLLVRNGFHIANYMTTGGTYGSRNVCTSRPWDVPSSLPPLRVGRRLMTLPRPRTSPTAQRSSAAITRVEFSRIACFGLCLAPRGDRYRPATKREEATAGARQHQLQLPLPPLPPPSHYCISFPLSHLLTD